MKRIATAVAAVLGVVVLASPAPAHVTVQPNEGLVGSFSRFVVRVPNEQDDASTTKVKVEFPPLAFVSFEPKEGWKRSVEMVEFDEPIEVFGEEVTEGVGSVTWSGGEIKSGEFDEFGFSARMPDGEETLEFPAFQTYSNGDVVEWTGPPDAGEPAALVNVYDIGAAEDEGQIAVLAKLAQGGSETEEEDDGEDDSNLGVILGGAALALSVIALGLSLRKRAS